jgi:hypothetical protein
LNFLRLQTACQNIGFLKERGFDFRRLSPSAQGNYDRTEANDYLGDTRTLSIPEAAKWPRDGYMFVLVKLCLTPSETACGFLLASF